jgi:transcription initiation factor TFIID TATA-box-binding protein
MPVPKLQNVVATFCVLPEHETQLDLNWLLSRCPFMEFDSKRFAAVVARLRKPKTTCLLFASGKAVCTGAKTESEARTACMKYVNLFCSSGRSFRFIGFKIENIVSAVHCPFRLDLRKIADDESGWINYEPTLFPGLIFRKPLDRRKKSKKRNMLVFICFQSGKCVITGGRSRSEILAEWVIMFNDVLSHNIAEVDYGSSGNYRVAQASHSYQLTNHNMLRSICYFNPSGEQNDQCELRRIALNQNTQSRNALRLAERIIQHHLF